MPHQKNKTRRNGTVWMPKTKKAFQKGKTRVVKRASKLYRSTQRRLRKIPSQVNRIISKTIPSLMKRI